MFPIPTAERSIMPRFSKAVRYKPSLIEATFDGRAAQNQRDKQAALFVNNPSHALWSHFSVPDSDYNPGSRKHVAEIQHGEHDSRKRSKYHCAPLSDEYLTSRILPPSGNGVGGSSGLADTRPEVVRLAQQFSEQPFRLNIGDDPRNQATSKPREVDPCQRASSNPLLITGNEPSVKSLFGKKPLELPRAATTEPPPTFAHCSTFGKYSEPERHRGKRTTAKQQVAFDPLHIKATNGGRCLENAPSDCRDHFFVTQQRKLQAELQRGTPQRHA